MGKVTDAVVSALIAAVEAAGTDTDKISLGDPSGDPITIVGWETFERGMSWLYARTGVRGFLDYLLAAVGGRFDRADVVHGQISTNATGVPASIVSSIGLSSVVKSEGGNTLTLTFEAYDNTGYVLWGEVDGTNAILRTSSRAVGSVVVTLGNPATGGSHSINNRTVYVAIVGSKET